MNWIKYNNVRRFGYINPAHIVELCASGALASKGKYNVIAILGNKEEITLFEELSEEKAEEEIKKLLEIIVT